MPWPREHKAETRDRILTAAAAAFREEGVEGVSVAEVMARAGLTHGGFYAHFASKDELLAESLDHALRETRDSLARSSGVATATRGDTGGAHAADQLLAVADAYLSPLHRDHPERGCPIAALAPELTRADRSVRRSLASSIRARLDWLAGFLPGRLSRRERERRATAAFACMVGGMLLSRGLDEADGLRVLADCRAFLHEALGSSSTSADEAARRARRRH